MPAGLQAAVRRGREHPKGAPLRRSSGSAPSVNRLLSWRDAGALPSWATCSLIRGIVERDTHRTVEEVRQKCKPGEIAINGEAESCCTKPTARRGGSSLPRLQAEIAMESDA